MASRNVLAPIRNSGVEPEFASYLESLPGHAKLTERVSALSNSVRQLPRRKGMPDEKPPLDDLPWTDRVVTDALYSVGADLCDSPIDAWPLEVSRARRGGGPKWP